MSNVDRVIDAINAKYAGHVHIVRGSEYKTCFHLRRPTGVLSLDAALRGGWPAGTLCQIFGPESIGKDYLCNCTMREVQRQYGDDANIAVASFGYPVHDAKFAMECGVDFDRVHVIGYDKERRADQVNKPAERILDTVLELVATGDFQLIILNEVGAESTADREDKDMTEAATIADSARMFSQFQKKFYPAIGRPIGKDEHPNETTVLLVLQARTNINPYSHGGMHMPSGMALRYMKTVDVHLRATGLLKGKDDGVYGKSVKWEIHKGKLGIHDGASGEYEFIHDVGVNPFHDAMTAGRAHGVLRLGDQPDWNEPGKKAPQVIFMEGKTEFWRSDETLLDVLAGDEALLDYLRSHVLAAVNAYGYEGKTTLVKPIVTHAPSAPREKKTKGTWGRKKGKK